MLSSGKTVKRIRLFFWEGAYLVLPLAHLGVDINYLVSDGTLLESA